MTNLQAERSAAGLSQSQLAREADISLRTLQAYEQGWRSINAASAETVLRISRALGCTIERILE